MVTKKYKKIGKNNRHLKNNSHHPKNVEFCCWRWTTENGIVHLNVCVCAKTWTCGQTWARLTIRILARTEYIYLYVAVIRAPYRRVIAYQVALCRWQQFDLKTDTSRYSESRRQYIFRISAPLVIWQWHCHCRGPVTVGHKFACEHSLFNLIVGFGLSAEPDYHSNKWGASNEQIVRCRGAIFVICKQSGRLVMQREAGIGAYQPHFTNHMQFAPTVIDPLFTATTHTFAWCPVN